ncbi:MAG: DUF3391 domain-containing protein [gamma proteobacterium symbiont of Lucinoma myriamae]|nr:DUF3391 domain-containing protein [gamma proteobacterium symbiont of Lucinoma myriamae]
MAVKNKKILAQNIVVGMYVSALDRPWIETDFLLEGFYLENGKDVQRIQQLCEYVYIDVELTNERIKINSAEPSLFSKIKKIATTDVS